MKKLTTKIIKNGIKKEIFAIVDDETAKVLESADEAIRHQYICDEYKDHLFERKETRRHQSLDASLEGGYEFVDESADIEALLYQQEDNDRLHEALMTLSEPQRWLVAEIYFNGRKQNEIARELGVGITTINNRLKRILEKIKKLLN